uniref:Family with sequence similarity 187 member A n=1 Tax=Cynoglossus semilaevis TaxID=244447 RepID=A0A3P8VFD5_CYNSE
MSTCVLVHLYLHTVVHLWSTIYEAPEEEVDVFERKACPAFLTFINVAYLAGVTVELPCHCKPKQIQSVVWFYRTRVDSFEETRALTDHHGNKLLDTSKVPHSGDLRSRFSIRLFRLMIFRAGSADSGLYLCGSAHKDFFYAYDVDIQEARSLTKLTSDNTTEKPRIISTKSMYQVFTHFRPWSVCDRCGVPGEQVRAGLCYVHSKYLHVRYRQTNQTAASCGSGAVPMAFGSLKHGQVEAGLEVKSCQVTCSNQTSSTSKLSTVMKFISFLLFGNSVLTMGCPGAQADMAVAWDRGSEPIYRSKHLSGGNLGPQSSRLQIDTGHHLLFKPAQTEDSGVYYCWIQGRPAARINLLVHVRLGKRRSVMSHPEFPRAVKTVLISYAVMVGVFLLLVLGRAVMRHRRDSTVNHLD